MGREKNIIVQMESISKSFPGVQALKDVDFICSKGEVHAIVGENGAGKSTLINILGGVFSPDSGKIYLNGKNVKFKSPHAAQHAGISIIHQQQELVLVPYMSVAENILLGQEICGRSGFVKLREMKNRATDVLDIIGAKINTNDIVFNLGSTKQKLVQIAKALVLNPNILVVDEPTASLGKQEAENFFKVLRTLRNSGTTIIYISHLLEEIFKIADRVTILKDGVRVATKKISETDIDEVVRLMIGRELGNLFPKKKDSEDYSKKNRLSVRNLNRGNELLDINMNLYSGEILGIAGLEGNGQKALLKTIFGALEKDKGEIYIDGKQVTIKKPSDAIESGMALITDKRATEGLCLGLNVKHNFALPTLRMRQVFGIIRSDKEKEIVINNIKDLNVKTPSLTKIVKYLSGGNQQKIVVGKWLNAEPRILLFIEPTIGIDVGAKTEIYQLIRELADSKGRGVVVVTSDMLELRGLCDRILVMYKGKIVSEIDGKDATEESIIEAAVNH